MNLNYFGTEGILLGLLAEGTGTAARILTASKVNFEAVQHLVEQWTVSLTVPPAEIPAELPWTRKACRVMELALE